MQTPLSSFDGEFLRRNVGLRRPHLGQSEFELCLATARSKNPDAHPAQLVAMVVDELDAWRFPFSGGSTDMKDSQWNKVFAESELAARKVLLGESTSLRKVVQLTEKVTETKNQLDAAERELDQQWNEFLAIPDVVARLDELLGRIANERISLDPQLIEKGFQAVYREFLIHPERGPQTFAAAVEIIVTAKLRIPVLDQLEAETRAEIEKLKLRNKALSAKLDRHEHKFASAAEG